MSTPYSEGFMSSKGFKIHFLEWGSKGLPVVILHSMQMDAHGFDAFSKSIANSHKVLALDILDHGDSEKPTKPVGLEEHAEVLREVYKRLDYSPNVLIGHSIGGMLGMILAAKYPKEILGLVLVDIAPRDPKAPPRPPRPASPEYFANEKEAEAFVKERFPKFTKEAVENRLKYGFIRDPDGRLHLKSKGDAVRGGIDTDLWPYVERIKIPTLLLVAEEGVISGDTVKRMQSLVSKLEAKTIKGATHMIPQDKPAEFEREVRALLTKIQKAH